jgi:hypothetical protein
MITDNLKTGDVFKFTDKKTVYKVLAKTQFYIQFEDNDFKINNTLIEAGYKQKAFYKEVEVITEKTI